MIAQIGWHEQQDGRELENMEYQLRTKSTLAFGMDPGDTLLALFEGRISPEQQEFELMELSSGTFNNIHEHSSLCFPEESGSVRRLCNPSTILPEEESPSFFVATNFQEGMQS